ncbi:MAG: class I SAM-dependent methyltransferase, partial [Candidatus Eremiobacteraeota bacterium]|nr:class I SAM-dependent methyltransferase [Candidatus Eremiobacteraeota bacterium]
GESLPFEDESFDHAAAITVLEFVRRPKKVISEMKRVVHPGGKLIFGVLNRVSPLGRERKNRKEPVFASARFYSPGELKKLLCSAGHCNVRATCFVPKWHGLWWLVDVTEFLGQFFHLPWGDFIIGEVIT